MPENGPEGRPAVPPAARWLVDSGTPLDQLLTFGPSGYEAWARIRFISDPSWPGQDEADAEVPEGHLLDLDQVQIALRRLSDFTGTPEDCCFCIWDGYSTVTLPSGSEWFELPHRRYALVRAGLALMDSYADRFGSGLAIPPPAFVWPADRRWFFACDVDPHWAGVGASRPAVLALLACPDLDVVMAEPGARQPLYY